MTWPIKHAVEVANRFAELNDRAPRELSLDLSGWSEKGERYIGIDGCFAGDVAAGLKLLEPVSKWGKGGRGEFRGTTYQAVQRQFDTRAGGAVGDIAPEATAVWHRKAIGNLNPNIPPA